MVLPACSTFMHVFVVGGVRIPATTFYFRAKKIGKINLIKRITTDVIEEDELEIIVHRSYFFFFSFCGMFEVAVGIDQWWFQNICLRSRLTTIEFSQQALSGKIGPGISLNMTTFCWLVHVMSGNALGKQLGSQICQISLWWYTHTPSTNVFFPSFGWVCKWNISVTKIDFTPTLLAASWKSAKTTTRGRKKSFLSSCSFKSGVVGIGRLPEKSGLVLVRRYKYIPTFYALGMHICYYQFMYYCYYFVCSLKYFPFPIEN